MGISKLVKLVAVGLGLGVLGNTAMAQVVTSSCSSIISQVQSCNGNASCIATYQEMHPECFGSSSNTAVATQQIGSTSLQQVLAISNALSSRLNNLSALPGATADSGQRFGMAAGNTGSKWNAWVSVNDDKNKYDRGGFTDPAIDGTTVHNNKANVDVTNAVFGADYIVSPLWTVGLSVAFDNGSGSTESFKQVGGIMTSNGVSNMSTDGYTVAPYAAMLINQNWSLDATLGFGKGKLSSDGGLTGKNDRQFYGMNLNYAKWNGNWQITGKGSYFYGEEKYDDLNNAGFGTLKGTATKNKLDQLRLGGQAGYWMDGVMPYIGLAYSGDLNHSSSATAGVQMGTEIGKSAWLCSVGVNFFSLKNGITGGIAYNQESGRDHAKHDGLIANISFRF